MCKHVCRVHSVFVLCIYIYTHTLLSPCCAYCICFFFWEVPIVLRFGIAGPLCLVQYPSSFVQYPSSFMPLCLWRRISLLLKFLLTVWNIQVHARWEKRGRLWWRSDFCEVGYVCNRVHCLFARPLTVKPFFLSLISWSGESLIALKPVVNWANVCSRTWLEVFGEPSS